MIDTKTGEIIKRPEEIRINPLIHPQEFDILDFQKERYEHKYRSKSIRYKEFHYRFSTMDEKGNAFKVLLILSSNQLVEWQYCIKAVWFENYDLLQIHDFYERLESLKDWNDAWMKSTFGESPEMIFWWGKIYSPPLNAKLETSPLLISYDFEKLIEAKFEK